MTLANAAGREIALNYAPPRDGGKLHHSAAGACARRLHYLVASDVP